MRWEPALEGEEPVRPPGERVASTQDAVSGMGLGCLFIGLGWLLLGGIVFRIMGNSPSSLLVNFGGPVASILPLALLGIVYFQIRRRWPSIARGLGISLVIGAALFLGSLVVCRPH